MALLYHSIASGYFRFLKNSFPLALCWSASDGGGASALLRGGRGGRKGRTRQDFERMERQTLYRKATLVPVGDVDCITVAQRKIQQRDVV